MISDSDIDHRSEPPILYVHRSCDRVRGTVGVRPSFRAADIAEHQLTRLDQVGPTTLPLARSRPADVNRLRQPDESAIDYLISAEAEHLALTMRPGARYPG